MTTNNNSNNNQNNIPFQQPFAIDNNDDIGILDYDYNEMHFEKVDEELLQKFHDFEFKE